MPRTRPRSPPAFTAEIVRLVGVPRPLADAHGHGPWRRGSHAVADGRSRPNAATGRMRRWRQASVRSYTSCAARCARCVRSGDGIYRAAAERVFATLAIELPARHRFPPTERHPTRALRRHRGVLAHPPQGFRAGGALTRGRRAGEVCSPRRSLTASCPPHRETPMFSRMCLSGQVDDGFHLFYYFLC